MPSLSECHDLAQYSVSLVVSRMCTSVLHATPKYDCCLSRRLPMTGQLDFKHEQNVPKHVSCVEPAVGMSM